MTRVALACLLLAGCVAEQPPWNGVAKPEPAHVPDAGYVTEHLPCDAGIDCVAVRVTVLE